MRDLQGKRALVTGGASGIGLGIARALAAAGVDLLLADIEAGPLAAAAKSLRASGREVRPVALDVSDRAQMHATAERLRIIGDKLHIIVNNAGVGYHARPLHQSPDEVFDWVFGVNVAGVFNGIKAFVPLLLEHGEGGHVVNTGSMGGFLVSDDPAMNAGLYSASKFAVTAMTEALRNDLAPHDIGVSLLAPAFVDTHFSRSDRNRPDGAAPDDLNTAFHARLATGMDADDVGALVVQGIRANLPYIFSHPAGRRLVEARHARILDGFEQSASL